MIKQLGNHLGLVIVQPENAPDGMLIINRFALAHELKRLDALASLKGFIGHKETYTIPDSKAVGVIMRTDINRGADLNEVKLTFDFEGKGIDLPESFSVDIRAKNTDNEDVVAEIGLCISDSIFLGTEMHRNLVMARLAHAAAYIRSEPNCKVTIQDIITTHRVPESYRKVILDMVNDLDI